MKFKPTGFACLAILTFVMITQSITKKAVSSEIDFEQLAITAIATFSQCQNKNNRAAKIKFFTKKIEKKLQGLDSLEFVSGTRNYAAHSDRDVKCSNEFINSIRDELETLLASYVPSGREMSLASRFDSNFISTYRWNEQTKKFLFTQVKEWINLWVSPKPCPTLYWWSSRDKTKGIENFKQYVAERLKDWPESTIEFCKKDHDLILEGNLMNLDYHQKFWERGIATFYFKKGGESFFTRAIIEQDLIGAKTGGKVYNQNLQEVCTFKFAAADSVLIKCPTLGDASGLFEIEDYDKGIFKVFADSPDLRILVTNLTVQEFKMKYPNLK